MSECERERGTHRCTVGYLLYCTLHTSESMCTPIFVAFCGQKGKKQHFWFLVMLCYVLVIHSLMMCRAFSTKYWKKQLDFFSALTTHSETSSILSIFGWFSLHTFKNRPCTCHGFFYYTLNISQSMCILIFLIVCKAKIGFFSKKSQFLAFLIFKPHF